MSTVVVGRRIRGVTDQPDFCLDAWPTPDVGSLSPELQAAYFIRKRAVELCIEGASDATIKSDCGIGLKQVTRLIRERCIAPSPDGQIFGFRGLVKYQRITPPVRKKPVVIDKFGYGGTGAMGALLLGDPGFRTKLDSKILRVHKKNVLVEGKRHRSALWSWFLEELRARGYELRKEWPFNSASLGYQSLRKYTDTLLKSKPEVLAYTLGGNDAVRKLRAGDGVDRPKMALFHRVEMDAHKLDGRFCVLMPAPGGGWVARIIHRLWVVVIVEVVSRAVLGYHLSVRKEVNKEDVLRAIKCALTNWKPLEVSYCDKSLVDGAGLPSILGPDYVGICWKEMSVDGALAETCKTVKDKLANVVGAELLTPENSFSVRRSLDDRPYIESFFRTLGDRALHKLSNTTGSNPKDPRKVNPIGVAIESQFQYEYLIELLQSLICNYNAGKHSALGYRSPLELLQYFFQQGFLPEKRADPELVQSLLSYRKLCTVLGGAAEGRVPYVNFDHGRYGGPAIADREDLVGTKVWMANHIENDARVARCTTLSGQLVGVLRVAPPWDKLPHTISIRRSIKALQTTKRIESLNNDAIRTFMKFVENQNSKALPVHPAYLEVRRILSEQAANFEGDAAAERVFRSLKERKHASAREQKDPESGSGIGDTSVPRIGKYADRKPLPAKRLAKD